MGPDGLVGDLRVLYEPGIILKAKFTGICHSRSLGGGICLLEGGFNASLIPLSSSDGV